MPRMKEWLKYIDMQNGSCHTLRSNLYALGYTQDMRNIRDQIALLHAVKYPPRTCATPTAQRRTRIALEDWHMCGDQMLALSSLPQQQSCEWPLQPGKYKQLGRCVPCDIRWWVLDEDMPDDVVESIIAGINSYRKSSPVYWERKSEVYLHVSEHEGPDKRVGNCVIVTNRYP